MNFKMGIIFSNLIDVTTRDEDGVTYLMIPMYKNSIFYDHRYNEIKGFFNVHEKFPIMYDQTHTIHSIWNNKLRSKMKEKGIEPPLIGYLKEFIPKSKYKSNNESKPTLDDIINK